MRRGAHLRTISVFSWANAASAAASNPARRSASVNCRSVCPLAAFAAASNVRVSSARFLCSSRARLIAVSSASEFFRRARRASAAAASARRFLSASSSSARAPVRSACNPEIRLSCAVALAFISSIRRLSASVRAAASRACSVVESISSRAFASARFSASSRLTRRACSASRSVTRAVRSPACPRAASRSASRLATWDSKLVIRAVAVSSSPSRAESCPLRVAIRTDCVSLSASAVVRAVPSRPTSDDRSSARCRSSPRASANVATCCVSESSSSPWVVIVSRRTDWTRTKTVSTNISTIRSDVIASTKPGQIGLSGRALRRDNPIA